MNKLMIAAATVLLSSAMTFGADQTWNGKISDSSCGASHKAMAAEHGGAKTSDRDCTLACVKGGSKYVFVTGGKVYNIANQDYAGLEQHAGHAVKLTGSMMGGTITVSSIEMPGKKKAAD